MSGYQDDPYKKTFHTPSSISLIRYFWNKFGLENLFSSVMKETKEISEITIEELQTAVNRLKKGKAADSNGMSAEDNKACGEETKEMLRQIFNEVIKQKECTSEAWQRKRKSDTQKRWRWRCWKVSPDLLFACAVQTVYDNIVQQTLSQTWSNPSRRSGRVQMHISGNGSSGDVQNDWTKMSWVGSQNVGCYNWFHEGVWFQSHTTQFGTPSNPAVSNMITSTLWKDYSKTKKDTVMIDEESMFEIKNGTKQDDPLSSLLFNTVLQMALRDDLPGWQKKRGLCICLGDNDHDCLTSMRFADGVLLFASSEEQLQNMLCDFKRSTEKVGLRIHPGKTIILSNESSNIRKKVRLKTSKSIY